MNPWRNIFACVCATLLVAFGQECASAADYWADGFETNYPLRWSSTGVWQIGNPAIGPAVNAQGYRTFDGKACASTEYYAYNQNVRLTCTSYLKGSNTLVVPPASLSPTLTFWHWLNLANAAGYVELNNSNGWQQISQTYQDITSGGTWVQSSVDLSGYAGQSVQIGFHFISGPVGGNSLGWFVDDVALTIVAPPVLTVPGDQTVFAGQTFSATASATNVYLPNAKYSFNLAAHPAGALINPTNGVITWAVPANRTPGANLFTVQVTDNSIPAQIATNSFVVTVVNPWIPELTVPATQTIFAGQPLTVACSVNNSFFPNDTFTFAVLKAGPTNVDLSDLANGVLSWDATNTLVPGTYTNIIKVTDNSPPNYSATNSFLVVISSPPPPTLFVPATQNIYAGQPLTVTNDASNSAYPDDTFTFAVLSSTSNLDTNDLATDGVLTLTTDPTNKASVRTITVKVTENEIHWIGTNQLSATNSFQVIISPTPPPFLIIPGIQTNYAGQILSITNSATNAVFPDATFIFRFAPTNSFAATNLVLDPATGVLTWTNTGVVNGVLTWTNNSVAPRTNVIYLAVDCLIAGGLTNGVPLSATNHVTIIFLPPVPPSLIAPTNWVVYFGQRFTNTLTATNVFLPASRFVFSNALAAASSTNVIVLTNGLLIWTNVAAAPGNYNASAKVTDNSNPRLNATTSFSVHVVPPPSQLVLTNLALVGSNFHFTIATTWTNSWSNTWMIVASTNLNGALTNWLPVFTNQTGPGGAIQFTDALSTNYLRRFYRAVYP